MADSWAENALHVAMATVASCTMIASLNFKHIVHYDKISLYKAINPAVYIRCEEAGFSREKTERVRRMVHGQALNP